MSDHYYSKKPHSQLKTEEITCTLREQAFSFTTGSGVFSKKGIDFGSRLLIETFEEPTIDGPFLDLGCGYGPIGISLASTYKGRSFVMTDINERAIYLTNQNIQKNNISNAKAFISEGFNQIKEDEFAAIITNPPIRAGKKVVYSMIEKSVEHLSDAGEYWAVIQKKQGAPSFLAFLKTLFPHVIVENRRKGYYIIRAIKG